MKAGCQSIDNMKEFILENEHVFMSVIPEAGAKIYKLISKDSGNDFAWHSPVTPIKKPEYGSSFIPYDSGGFDEMLPTVGECDWRGKHLPDHGEAWQLPWEVVEKNSSSEKIILKLACTMKSSPFKIERTIVLNKNECRFRLDYKITNIGDTEWEYIWACHGSVSPGGMIGSGDRIFMPENTRVNVWWSEGNRLGKQGTWHEWPITKDKDGNEVDLSIIGDKKLGFADKLFTNELSEGWIAVLDTKTGEAVGFVFPLKKLPYAGIWINQGGWRGYSQLGLEATNALGDALDVAVEGYLKTYAALKAGETTKFSVWVSLYNGLGGIKSISDKCSAVQVPVHLDEDKVYGLYAFPINGVIEIGKKGEEKPLERIMVAPWKIAEINVPLKEPGEYEIMLKDSRNNSLESLGIVNLK